MMKKNNLLCILLWLLLFTLAAEGAETVDLDVQIPFSMKTRTGFAVPGSEVNAYFLVESKAEQAVDVDLEIKLPEGFSYQNLPDSWEGSGQRLKTRIALQTAMDNWFDLLTFQADKNLKPGIYYLEVRTKINQEITLHKYPVKVSSVSGIGHLLSLEKLLLPVNESGQKDGRYRADSLIMRESKSEFLRSIFRGTGAVDTLAEESHPLTYLGALVKNTGEEPLTLLIKTELINTRTGKKVPEFHLPEVEGNKQPKGSIQLTANLKGREKKMIAVPLYLNESSSLKAGEYLLKTKIFLMGSDMVLAEEDKTVHLITKDNKPAAITFAAFSLSLLAFIIFLKKQKRILNSFKTKELILIALFGTASFLSVNIPGTILSDLAHVFLGPFSFLLTGLFNGVILYTLLISLVLLIPRPGVIFLINLVRFLLNGIALGHFTPLTLLYYLTTALILELFLYAGGITRGAKLNSLTVCSMAVVSGLADAFAAYINFQGIIFLYRLYYADWYINLYLLIGSFLYTVIGVVLGVVLGKKLQKISMD